MCALIPVQYKQFVDDLAINALFPQKDLLCLRGFEPSPSIKYLALGLDIHAMYQTKFIDLK